MQIAQSPCCLWLYTVILASQGVLYASRILTSASEPHFIYPTGLALQIQCYQCEEFQLNNDCSSPEFIVNCTVNVQDMCQKEVMEQSAGKLDRSSPSKRHLGLGMEDVKLQEKTLTDLTYMCS